MPDRIWLPKIICRSWRHWPLECPWHGYDGATGEHHCYRWPQTKLATTRHGSPRRRPDCPVERVVVSDKSYRPPRQP